MIHQTFVRWALYIILFKFVKSLIRHMGLAIRNVDMSDDFREHCLDKDGIYTYWNAVYMNTCNKSSSKPQKQTMTIIHHYTSTGQYLLTHSSPKQNGCNFEEDIFKYIFLNENVWISINISLKFVPKGQINNDPAFVQIMACRRPGDKAIIWTNAV